MLRMYNLFPQNIKLGGWQNLNIRRQANNDEWNFCLKKLHKNLSHNVFYTLKILSLNFYHNIFTFNIFIILSNHLEPRRECRKILKYFLAVNYKRTNDKKKSHNPHRHHPHKKNVVYVYCRVFGASNCNRIYGKRFSSLERTCDAFLYLVVLKDTYIMWYIQVCSRNVRRKVKKNYINLDAAFIFFVLCSIMYNV